MTPRHSEDSIKPSINSESAFITPQASISSHPPPNEGSQQHSEYTENPYHTDHQIRKKESSLHHDVNDPEAALGPSHHARNSFETAQEGKGIAGSIASYFRRNSHSSNRTHGESARSHKEDSDETKSASGASHNSKEEIEYEKRLEDPQHLLDTILEAPEEEIDAPLLSSDDAEAVAAAAAGISSAESISQASTTERRRGQGFRDNVRRQRRLRRYTKASRTIHKLRHICSKIMGWALVVRIFVYWLPLAIILFIPLAVGAWQNPNMELGGTRVMWIFIWLEVCWASLWIGKLFAHYMPEIVGFILSIFLPRYFRYVDMFLSLELAVQLLIWTFVTFITFPPLLTANGNALDRSKYPTQPRWQKKVQQVCVALLVSAIVFFVEQVFMYLLSTSFHRTRMSLRIETQKKSVNVLIILLDMAYSFFPYQCSEFDEEDESLRYATLKRASKRVSQLNSKNKVLNKVKQTVTNAANNIGNLVIDATGDSNYQKPPSAAKIVKNALTNRDTREILANRIWKSLVMEDSNALTYEDLLSVCGKDRKEEVLFMFDVLDSDGQDGISLEEMVDSVNRIGREAKQISKSLVDINGAITKLHYLLMCVALVLIVVIFVGMLAPSSATVLATLGSTLLSMSFLFSATAQEVFQSCIFLFVKHPYDAGDWIQTSVPSVGIVRMQVAEVNLMYSVFNQVGVNTRSQVSHSVLNNQFIDNISRSPPSQISVVLTIGIPETTPEQLEEFEARLTQFVEENPRDYLPGVYFQATDQPDLDRFRLTIAIGTRNNQADIVLFSNRRTKALEFIGQCIHEIPITIPHREDQSYHDPALPIFHYNIKDIDDAMKFAENSKGKRRAFGMRQAGANDEPEAAVHEDTNAERSAHDGGQVRRMRSVSSHQSYMSRAFSTASRASQSYGLRPRFPRHPVNYGPRS